MHQQAVAVARSYHRLDLFPFGDLIAGEVRYHADKLRFLIQLHRRQRFDGVRQQAEILMVDIVFPQHIGQRRAGDLVIVGGLEF